MSIQEEKAPFIAKAEQDPYSQAIMEVVEELASNIEQQIHFQALKLEPHQLYYLEGSLWAYKSILAMPEAAKKHLIELEEEKKA